MNRQTLVINDLTGNSHKIFIVTRFFNFTLSISQCTLNNVHSETFRTDAQVSCVSSASSVADSYNAIGVGLREEGLGTFSATKTPSF